MVSTNRERTAGMPSWPWERLPYGRWLGRLGLGALMLGAAWVLASWPLSLAGALLVAGLAALPLILWPALGLPLLAWAVPFGSLRTITLGPAQLGVEEVLLAATAAAWLARRLVRRELRLVWPSCAVAGLLLLAAMLAALLPASSFTLAAKEMLKWVELWLAAMLVLNALGATGAILLALGLLAAGAVEGLLGLYQFFTQSGPPGFVLMDRFMRASGTFDQPNPYGGYLGLALPLAAGLLLTAWPVRVSEASRPADDGRVRLSARLTLAIWLTAAVAGALIAGGLLASWSRGAWLGAAAGVAAVVVARGGRWLRGLVLVGVVGVLFCLLLWGRVPLPGALQGRLAGLTADLALDASNIEVDDANFAVVERAAHWQAALGMLRDHPWTGVGLGNYTAAYAKYALPRWPDPLGHAHNYYLSIAAEAGLPGLAAYLVWVGAGLWLAVQAVRRSQGLWQGLALGALGMWVHLGVHSLFDNLYVHGMSIQIGLMLGLAAWVVASSRDHELERRGLGG